MRNYLYLQQVYNANICLYLTQSKVVMNKRGKMTKTSNNVALIVLFSIKVDFGYITLYLKSYNLIYNCVLQTFF